MATKKAAQFRPMLAARLDDVSELQFPVLASPKYDGIRCVIRGGRALARSLKPIKNKHVRRALEGLGGAAEGFDGEIMLPYPATFHDVSSAVNAHDEPPPSDWFFVVFDRVPTIAGEGFASRVADVQRAFDAHPKWRHAVACEHVRIETSESLVQYEEKMLSAGHEGVMGRPLESPYKCGRVTPKEGHMWKLKRFLDAEAEIIGVLELQHNGNKAFVGELGQTKRRTLKAGKIDGGVMGKLVVRDLKTGVVFKIGTGFTWKQRVGWWRCRDVLLGRIARYRYQAHGVKDKPRVASFQGIRDRRDMSAG